jgi:hypothetical protein
MNLSNSEKLASELNDLDLEHVAGGKESSQSALKSMLGIGSMPPRQKPNSTLGGTRGLGQLKDAINNSRAPGKSGGGWSVKDLGQVRG